MLTCLSFYERLRLKNTLALWSYSCSSPLVTSIISFKQCKDFFKGRKGLTAMWVYIRIHIHIGIHMHMYIIAPSKTVILCLQTLSRPKVLLLYNSKSYFFFSLLCLFPSMEAVKKQQSESLTPNPIITSSHIIYLKSSTRPLLSDFLKFSPSQFGI